MIIWGIVKQALYITKKSQQNKINNVSCFMSALYILG